MKKQTGVVGEEIEENLLIQGKVGKGVTIIFPIIHMKIIVILHIKKI